LIRREKELFLNAGPDDVVRRQKANRMDQWFQPKDPFTVKSGCTVQAKAAIMYNSLLTRLGLTGRYPFISSGDKVKWGYVKPNRYDAKAIGYSDQLPPEFGIDLDYDLQFEKIIGSAVDKMFDVLEWRKPNLDSTDSVDLFEFFLSGNE
jgi:hypothetical protein